MNDYPLTVTAGGRKQFSTGSASRVIVLDCSALVTIVVQGKKPGQLRELPVQAGTWFTTSFDFQKIQVKNANAADVTLQLLVGDPGNSKDRYEHPVAKVVGSLPVPSIYTPGEMTLLTVGTQVNVSGDLYTNGIVIPDSNGLRKALHVRVFDGGAATGNPMDPNQTLNFGYCVFDTSTGQPHNDPFPSGFPLTMGEGRSIENSGEILLYASYPIEGSQVMGIFIDEEF